MIKTNTPPDFVILDRYNDVLWEAKWLKHKSVFAWHIETNSAVNKKVEEISDMTIAEFSEQIKQGNYPFKTIRLENL